MPRTCSPAPRSPSTESSRSAVAQTVEIDCESRDEDVRPLTPAEVAQQQQDAEEAASRPPLLDAAEEFLARLAAVVNVPGGIPALGAVAKIPLERLPVEQLVTPLPLTVAKLAADVLSIITAQA